MNTAESLKIRIAERAASRYTENVRFSLNSLAKELEMDPPELFRLFPNRSSILDYYYESRFEIYKNEISAIESYENYSLSEKLNTLILSLLDQFMEQREFVLMTYKQRVLTPMSTTRFKALYRQEMEIIFRSDSNRCSASTLLLNSFFFHALFQTFNGILWFWSHDRSEQYENSMALVDKWSVFTQEVFYTRAAEKGVDLGKFILMNSPLRNYFGFGCNPVKE
ncbi:MAG: hypothetical protein EA360_03145 [Balneolaceae bacterium]|nr:MAG: hypothetical protein EA360_03145 [Balneolaceae bacterium]